MQSFLSCLRLEGITLVRRLGIGRPGGFQTILIHIALLAVFGIVVPWMKGPEFMDPAIISAYACMGVLFAAPSTAQAFAESSPGASMSESEPGAPIDAPARISWNDGLARVVAAVVYGEVFAAAMLLAGIASASARGPFLPPDLGTLAGASLFGLTASFVLSAGAAWMTLRYSASAARGGLRVAFLLLLVAYFYWSRWLPDFAMEGALICLALSAAILFGLRGLLKGRA